MRDYGRIFCALWRSQDFRSLTEDGRALVLYLLSSPHTTMIGAFPLPDGYVCDDIQWNRERVAKGFAELFTKGFANRCGTTAWVWISKYLDWNHPDNPNQWKSAGKLVQQIPSRCVWVTEFQSYFDRSHDNWMAEKGKPLPNRSPTLSKQGEGEGIGKGSGKGTGEGARAQFDTFELMTRIQSIYPQGTYTGVTWHQAERELGKLVDAGEDPELIVANTIAYRDQQQALGKIGTQFIRSPKTFFGEGHWRGPFELPKSKTDNLTESNAAAAAEAKLRLFGSAA